MTLAMFGGIAGLVGGNLFGGLFGRSAIVKLDDPSYAEAMKLDGSEPFDPMGKGHVMSNTVLLGEGVMDEPAELRAWLHKAFDYAKTLPPKAKKQPSAKPEKPGKAKPSARLEKPAKAKPSPSSKRSVKPEKPATAKRRK